MPLFSRIRTLATNLLRRDRVEQELDREVSSYLNQLIDEKIDGGMSPASAHRAAMIELGGVAQVKEQVRDVRIGATIEQIWLDARYALRMLRKNPSFDV